MLYIYTHTIHYIYNTMKKKFIARKKEEDAPQGRNAAPGSSNMIASDAGSQNRDLTLDRFLRDMRMKDVDGARVAYELHTDTLNNIIINNSSHNKAARVQTRIGCLSEVTDMKRETIGDVLSKNKTRIIRII